MSHQASKQDIRAFRQAPQELPFLLHRIRNHRRPALLAACLGLATTLGPTALSPTARGQALPTASQKLDPQVFAGLSFVETGLDGGRNLSFTAGADISVYRRPPYTLALEYRGTLAVDKGSIDSQKAQLGGIKVVFPLPRLNPYADFLFGRGEITYAPPGYPVPNRPIFYTLSSSNVFSPGGGVDLNLSRHFALKADVQFQRYATPVTTSGHLFSTVATVGVVYRIRRKPYKP